MYVWYKTTRGKVYHRAGDNGRASCRPDWPIHFRSAEKPEGYRSCTNCWPINIPHTGDLDQWLEAKRLYESGFSIRQTAKYMDSTYGRIRSWLVCQGVELRPAVFHGESSRLSHEEIDRCVFLHEHGNMTQVEIGRKLGIKASAVATRLRHAGIPPRSRSEILKLTHARKRRGEFIDA